MATYLQGAVDYIPQIQPFAPNLNLYANVLQTKQSKYDSNWKSLNNVYSQYFYADLSREDNQERRDDLMNAIDFNLKKVSGLDLSLEQNVRQAKQLFTPFYEDKYLMRDMVYTKNYTQERNRGLSYKNARNEKDRENYWDDGVKYLDYKMQEFKDADLSETLNFGGLAYTPFVNIQKKAMDLAKQFGNVESTSFSPDGRYMIVNRNGEQLREPLHRLFEATFGNDPAAQEMFQVMAYVNRKDYSQVNASLFGGDAKQAEMKYLQEQFENFSRIQQVEFENQQDNLRVINNFISDLEKKDAAGILDDAGKKALREYRYSQEIIQTNLDRAEKLNTELNMDPGSLNSGKGFQNPYEDIETLRRKVDGAVANSLFSKQLQEAAQNYSIMNMKQTVTADPFAVIDYRHQKSKELANYKARVAKIQKAEEQRAAWDAEGINDPFPGAVDGGSGSVTEPINVIAFEKSVIEQKKQSLNNDLDVIVNLFGTLKRFGVIDNENFYKLTGYRTQEAFQKAQQEGRLIDNYRGLTPKKGTKINLESIAQMGKEVVGARAAGLSVANVVRKYAEVEGKKLDDLIQGTFNYLSDNRHVDGINREYQIFAGHSDAIYQRYGYYKESIKAHEEWVDKYIKPEFNNIVNDNTLFKGTGSLDGAMRDVGKLYTTGPNVENLTWSGFKSALGLGESKEFKKTVPTKKIKKTYKEDIIDIYMNSTNEQDFYEKISKESLPEGIRYEGLYERLDNKIKNVIETKGVPLPPNIIPFGQITSTDAVGNFVPNTVSINAKASDFKAPGTHNFIIANRVINTLGFDNTDTYIAFGNSITDKNEMNAFKDYSKKITSLFKGMMNQYISSKKTSTVNMTYTPMGNGSTEYHSLKITFPDDFAKSFKDNFNAIDKDENLWNNFLQNGNSFTVVVPAGKLDDIPLAFNAQYTQFEQYVIQQGNKGVTYKTKFPGITQQFLYKDGGMYLIEHENGQPKVDAVTNTFYGAPGSATRGYNNLLSNGYIIL
jgi:hypothetical protein